MSNATEATDATAPSGGRCDSRIVFGDDFGDNPCTFYCRLPAGHTGPHREDSIIHSGLRGRVQPYSLTWENDWDDAEEASSASLLDDSPYADDEQLELNFKAQT